MVDDGLYAHTPNEAGEWHGLREHLIAVAEAAERHASAFGAGDLGWWAGILHDAGKARSEWQNYLRLSFAEPGKPHKTFDHKGAGALRSLVLRPASGERSSEVTTVLATIIQAHHGGLTDFGELKSKLKEHRNAISSLGPILARYDGMQLPDHPPPELPGFVDNPHRLEFFTRMLFSALVDADHADTERHGDRTRSELRAGVPAVGPLWAQFETVHEQFVGGLTQAQMATAVNRIRGEVYAACVAAAEKPPGLYRLTVPTGGGKTRSALAFALKHAQIHCLDRVITAVPYLTITDQTAKSYRAIFAEDRTILEHHSAAGTAYEDERGTEDPAEKWRQLAAQNWDAPLVVTTMVQLLESLLGRRTTVCRKLHRIAKSVIILDEAQTVPTHLRGPVVDVLSELVSNYGATVVLCTATQPDLDTLGPGLDPVEIAPDPPRLFQTLNRVGYEVPRRDDPVWSWEQVADEMRGADQVLTVVNTVGQAAALYSALSEADHHVHLSARMCGAHRRDVLDEVRARLKARLPCRLVSTQLIEAGVDLDFPLLLRAVAPLDRIVQAAGRCNREGTMDGPGRVVVFEPEDGGMPTGAYETGAVITRQLFDRGDLDLNDPETFDRYFAALHRKRPPDERGIQDLRAGRSYEEVAKRFKLIDDDSVSVIVHYRGNGADGAPDHGDIVADLVDKMKAATARANSGWLRHLVRRAQPYVVNLRERQLRQFAGDGLATELADGIWEWAELSYDRRLGVVHSRLDVGRLIVG